MQPKKPISSNLILLAMPLLTLLALFMHTLIPLKTTQLLPAENPGDRYTYADQNSGGLSTAIWLDESRRLFRCEMRQSSIDPYCAFARKLGNGEDLGIRLDEYQGLKIKINYIGKQPQLRVFMRHFDPKFADANDVVSAKFQSVDIATREFASEVDIKLHEFVVDPWWLQQVKLPRAFSYAEFSNIIILGIEIPAPIVMGQHDFEIVSFTLYGEWVTKEQWYFGIALSWIVVLILIAIMRFIGLKRSSASALRTSEERLNLALQGGREGIWEINNDNRKIYIERGGCVIPQLPDEQTIMSLAEFEKLIHADDKQRVRKYFNSFSFGGGNVFNTEFRFVSKHKRYNWLQLIGHSIHDKTITGTIRDITKEKKDKENLWMLANHDILTGLPNRGLFIKKLNEAIHNSSRTHSIVALLFLDLDKFKHVNDTQGHEAGDKLLKKVASFLSHLIDKDDTVARFGGDEFAIILNNAVDIKFIDRIAEKLIKPFNEGFCINKKNTGVGASVGIGLFPDHANTAEELLRCADMAMYHAKTDGYNKVRFYEVTMRDQLHRKNLLEQSLRQALNDNNDELVLYYQPRVEIKTGKIVSFEALSRWSLPELGAIPPSEFIAIAEESELIVKLGKNSLEQACKQLKLWHQAGFPDLRVAVNVSPIQFLRSNVPVDVLKILKKTDLEPRYLELELTENLIVNNPEKTIAMLSTLKAMGVRLSIDDFGTGYSSLSYLSQFPLDILKIDKSFIQQMNQTKKGSALTQSVIAIAHSLELEVIAEGVETKEQLEQLQELQCEYVQGYYFSKPIPAHEIDALLKSNQV